MDEDIAGVLGLAFFAIMGGLFAVSIVVALLPYIIMAALVGALAFVVFLAIRALVRWVIKICQPSVEELIERDYVATKHRLNDIAGQSWRNLAG